MTNRRLIVTMVVIPILTALIVGTDGVWLMGDARVFGVSVLGAAIVGAGLVGYFNWRAKFQRRIVCDADDERRVHRSQDEAFSPVDVLVAGKSDAPWTDVRVSIEWTHRLM